MIRVKAEGKRSIRHYIVITGELNLKLKKLAVSCNLRPAQLSFLCLDYVLSSPKEANEFLAFYHNKITYGTDGVFRRRVFPHYVSVDASTDLLMRKHADNLNIAPATFQALVLEFTLNSPTFIIKIQENLNTDERYRIVPTIHYTGIVTY